MHDAERLRAKHVANARERLRLMEECGAALRQSEASALAGMPALANAKEVIGEIEYSFVQYWFMLHNLEPADWDKLDKAARLLAEASRTLRDLPPHYLGSLMPDDSRWSLTATRLPVPLRRPRPFSFEEDRSSPAAMLQHAVERGSVWLRFQRRRIVLTSNRARASAELQWLVSQLAAVWKRRLGRPFQPRATKRGSLQEFIEQVIHIADPYVTREQVAYALRAIKLSADSQDDESRNE